MKRRGLSLLLCGLLAMVLLPAAVLAGGDSYDLWVNGRQVTKDNAADVLNDGGTVSYDAANNVLTLHDANLGAGTHSGRSISAAIFADQSIGTLKIRPEGTNTINCTVFGSLTAGIYGYGNLVFDGPGSLEIYALSLGSEANAVYAHTGNVTISSGTYSFEGEGTTISYGAFANSGMGAVTVTGGTATLIGKPSNSGVGAAIAGTLDVSSYAGCTVSAGVNADGSQASDYDPEVNYYTYIHIEPSVVPQYDVDGFQINGSGYQPAMLENGAYQIRNAGNLFWFAEQVKDSPEGTAVNAVLANDIVIPANRAWTPIEVGLYGTPYTGVFDGAGHTIGGMQTNDQQGGLFKAISAGSTVKNVGIVGGVLNGGVYCAGAIAGSNNGTIENCYNTGTVTGTAMFVGGIAGDNNGTIRNCYNTGKITVSGIGEGGGGICGTAGDDAIIENCYNLGDVEARWGVGGVCGYLASYSGDNIRISNCYNAGNLIVTAGGTPPAVDGIVFLSDAGLSHADFVSNCYTTAATGATGAQKTAEQFAAGEVAWLLNGQTSSGAWGQTIGTQATPVLGGAAVYRGYQFCYSDEQGYSNDPAAVHATRPAHDFSELACDATGHWTVCANSGCTETDGHAAHTAELRNVRQATCTEEGYTGDEVCTVCDYVVARGQVVARLPHTFVDGKCTVCGALEDAEIPETGDRSSTISYLLLLLLAGAGIALSAARMGRRNEE